MMSINRTLILALAALLLAGPTLAQPQARLGISPERFQVELEPGGSRTEALMVKNLSDEPLTVELSVGTWDLDENNRLRVIPPRKDSLDQWIIINPLRVTIPPDSPQTIRWAIVPSSKPQPGEYRAVIFVEEVLQERPNKDATSVRMKMRMGIPIYAQVGNPVDGARQVALKTEGTQVALTLANDGNRHARLQGYYGVWPEAAFPGEDQARNTLRTVSRGGPAPEGMDAVRLNEVVLLPGTERTLKFNPQLHGGGRSRVQFFANFGDIEINDGVLVNAAD